MRGKFTELFTEYVTRFKQAGGYYETLLNWDYKRAFDELLMVWCRDISSMARSGFTMVSIMNLLAEVHVKNELEKLREKLSKLEEKARKRRLYDVD